MALAKIKTAEERERLNYPKDTKELLKLCRKLCDRIAKEVA